MYHIVQKYHLCLHKEDKAEQCIKDYVSTIWGFRQGRVGLKVYWPIPVYFEVLDNKISGVFVGKPFYFQYRIAALSRLNPKLVFCCNYQPTFWKHSFFSWISFSNAGYIFVGDSSHPLRSSKTPDWLWWTNLKKFFFSSLVTPRGRSWSSMASQREELKNSSSSSTVIGRSCPSLSALVSRHLSDKTTWNCGKELKTFSFHVSWWPNCRQFYHKKWSFLYLASLQLTLF